MEAVPEADVAGDLHYMQYEHALEPQYLPAIRSLISKDLSEPYSIYVYHYFLYNWPHLCFMAVSPTDGSLVGVIICKLETHASHSPSTNRGYIAMLAVSSAHRGRGIATELVRKAIHAMTERKADEVVLETEETNLPAMRLYERLGFLRSKKLHRYYLNGNSAYRLVLLLKSPSKQAMAEAGMEEARLVAPSHQSIEGAAPGLSDHVFNKTLWRQVFFDGGDGEEPSATMDDQEHGVEASIFLNTMVDSAEEGLLEKIIRNRIRGPIHLANSPDSF